MHDDMFGWMTGQQESAMVNYPLGSVHLTPTQTKALRALPRDRSWVSEEMWLLAVGPLTKTDAWRLRYDGLVETHYRLDGFGDDVAITPRGLDALRKGKT